MLLLSIALLFFVIVPGIGAFVVRGAWRRFRARVREASLLPALRYRQSRGHHPHESHSERYHFLGALESIQGDRYLWLRSGEMTLTVDMLRSDVYMLPYSGPSESRQQLTRTSWRRAGSLIEGTKAFVAGPVDASGAHPVMYGAADEPVLVIFYEGPEHSLVRRLIRSGRQINEYWNQLTPVALAAGMLSLTILAYVLFRQPVDRPAAILSLGLGTAPALPLLPPGIAAFLLYRRWWRRGRALREHRDIVLLPSRYLSKGADEGMLPNDERYVRISVDSEGLERYLQQRVPVVRAPISEGSPLYQVYGTPGPDGLKQPESPLAELVAVAGTPESISHRCQVHARRYEALAVAVFLVGLATNLMIALALIQLLTR
jgi:hypothetical protein